MTNHPHIALALQILQGLLTPVIGLTTLYQNVVSMVSVSTGGSKPEVAETTRQRRESEIETKVVNLG